MCIDRTTKGIETQSLSGITESVAEDFVNTWIAHFGSSLHKVNSLKVNYFQNYQS